MASPEVSSPLFDLFVSPGGSDLLGDIATLRLYHALSVSYHIQFFQILNNALHFALSCYRKLTLTVGIKMPVLGAAKEAVKLATHLGKGLAVIAGTMTSPELMSEKWQLVE
jgi:hypothetical protein